MISEYLPSTCYMWNKIATEFKRDPHPLVEGDSCCQRSMKLLGNGLKKTALAMASVVAAVATPVFVLFDLIYNLFRSITRSKRDIPPEPAPSSDLPDAAIQQDINLSLDELNDKEKVLINFYQGSGVNVNNRRLLDILRWNDADLERVHNYIQWLFPLEKKSAFNREAPLLTPSVRALFNQSEALQSNLLASFKRMLSFYGLDMDGEGNISKGAHFQERSAVWLTPGNHNFQRITRILGSLNLLGLNTVAHSFFNALSQIHQEPAAQRAIGNKTFGYWQDAAAL